MTSSARWPDAALLGASGAMRTFVPPAMLAVRGRIRGRAHHAALAAAVGEIAHDKLPIARERVDVPSVGARVASGLFAGHAVAGPVGAVAGAASAAVSTFATYRARSLVGRATGIPDPWVGAAEDIVCVTAAAVATRPSAGAAAEGEEADAASADGVGRSAARGLLAGLAGTAAMTLAQGAYYQLTGAKPSDAPQRAGRKALERAGKRVPRDKRPALNQAMHWLYGTSWGIPYGVLAGSVGARPEPSGVAFGLSVWAIGLAHLPALDLAPAPWKQSPRTLAADAAFHVVYGLGAAGALRATSPGRR